MRPSHRFLLPAVAAAALATGMSGAHAQERGRHQVCEDVRVANTAKDKHQIAGTAVGAVAGGPLGAAVGAVANAVLQKPLSEMGAKTYHVSGPWKQPRVEVLQKEQSRANTNETGGRVRAP